MSDESTLGGARRSQRRGALAHADEVGVPAPRAAAKLAVTSQTTGDERCSPGRIGLVFADAHPIILQGMRFLLRAERDLQILSCCTNDEDALAAVRLHQPAIVVLELDLPRKGGLALLRDIARQSLSTRAVLLTGSITIHQMTEAMHLGVRGVVLKDMPPHLLVQCIRQVHRGEMWLEESSIGAVVREMQQREEGLHELRQKLTPRELQVLQLVAKGLRNRDITTTLKISEGTVKIHLHNIYGKLGIRDRLQLALSARSHGLV